MMPAADLLPAALLYADFDEEEGGNVVGLVGSDMMGGGDTMGGE